MCSFSSHSNGWLQVLGAYSLAEESNKKMYHFCYRVKAGNKLILGDQESQKLLYLD